MEENQVKLKCEEPNNLKHNKKYKRKSRLDFRKLPCIKNPNQRGGHRKLKKRFNLNSEIGKHNY